jgi:hypothetical protein
MPREELAEFKKLRTDGQAYSSLRYNWRGLFFLPFWAFCDPRDQDTCCGLNSHLFAFPIGSFEAYLKCAHNGPLRFPVLH